MNIKVNFISNISKAKAVNEIVFVKGTKVKNNILNDILKSILDNQLFIDQLFIQKEFKNKNYIFINCKNLLISSDYESIGSKLFDYLKKNKIQNAYIDTTKVDINDAQLEKTIHGAKLKSYNFNIYKSNNKKSEKINLSVVGKKIVKSSALRKKLDALLDGVFFTRDLVSEPGNILHPDEYVKRIIQLKKIGLNVKVYDEKKLKKLGCNALLGVGQGSIRGSYLVTIEWKGNKSKSKPFAFVGKGVCFDTGGISLKPAKFMEDMTYDMAGSAVVVGLMKNFALRKAKINAVGVVGLVENMPGGNAQRPGDIVKSSS